MSECWSYKEVPPNPRRVTTDCFMFIQFKSKCRLKSGYVSTIRKKPYVPYSPGKMHRFVNINEAEDLYKYLKTSKNVEAAYIISTSVPPRLMYKLKGDLKLSGEVLRSSRLY